VGRRGKKRALVAIGHKILISAYFILKDKVKYKEMGTEYLQGLLKEKQINRHLKILNDLGINVEIKKKVA
jgi:transposase